MSAAGVQKLSAAYRDYDRLEKYITRVRDLCSPKVRLAHFLSSRVLVLNPSIMSRIEIEDSRMGALRNFFMKVCERVVEPATRAELVQAPHQPIV